MQDRQISAFPTVRGRAIGQCLLYVAKTAHQPRPPSDAPKAQNRRALGVVDRWVMGQIEW